MKRALTFLLGFYCTASATAQTSASQTNNTMGTPCPGVSKIWDATFGGENVEKFSTIIKTKDGGYLIGGGSQSKMPVDKTRDTREYFDYWIVKVDTDGHKLWDKSFGGNRLDMLESVITTSDGGYLLAGYTYSDISGDVSEQSRGGADIWIVKTDANGNKQWDKRYGGKFSEGDVEVIATADGGYLLAGNIVYVASSDDKISILRGIADYWLVKIDANGNELWEKSFDGNKSDDLFKRIIATADGGFLLGGQTNSERTGEVPEATRRLSDFWIVKTDANGNKIWDKHFGGDHFEGIRAMIATPDGNYLLAGYSQSTKSGDVSEESLGRKDYWVVKIDANGTKLWDKRYGSYLSDFLTNMHLEDDGGLLLAGYTPSWITGEETTEQESRSYGYWIIKTDAGGEVIWNKIFMLPRTDVEDYTILSPALLSLGNGEFIFGTDSFDGITRNKTQESKGGSDFWIAKLKVCGNEKK